jgi:hypothetical protein
MLRELEKYPMPKIYSVIRTTVLAAGILILAVGLWLDVEWFPHSLSPVFYIINIFPGFMLMGSWFFASSLASKFPQRYWVWTFFGFGILVTLFGLILALYANFGVAMIMGVTTPIRDTAQYEEILEYDDDELVSHFPPHIPGNATKVAFYYSPPFMQGGSHLQLHCKLPSPQIDAVLEEYLPAARQIQDGTGNVLESSNEQSYIPSTSLFYEENSETVPMPEDFLVLILDAEPYESGNWNHGYIYGVAVSAERQEVIYWTERW